MSKGVNTTSLELIPLSSKASTSTLSSSIPDVSQVKQEKSKGRVSYALPGSCLPVSQGSRSMQGEQVGSRGSSDFKSIFIQKAGALQWEGYLPQSGVAGSSPAPATE